MKRITYLLIWVGLYGLFMTACKHDVDPVKPETTTPPPATESGAVQPVGTPQGTAVVKTIGPAGGSIQSEDGRFTVTIPAGALATDVAMRFGVLMGSFDVQTAGVYITSTPPIITTSTVRGVFRVKCLDCAK